LNFDLQKFFIGLMDFFSILLPGSLLTWLLMGEVARSCWGIAMPSALAHKPRPPSCSQLSLGHLVFLLARRALLWVAFKQSVND
jgi:hypothetical protein